LILRNILPYKHKFLGVQMRPIWRGDRDDGAAGRSRYAHIESVLRGVMRALDIQQGDLKNMIGRQTCVR
jgi:hypothetical protein